jgi:hypothetical protein
LKFEIVAILKRDQRLVWAFDFLFRLQEFFAPRFAVALRTLVNRVANSVTVIAGSFGAVARKLLTFLARLRELAFQIPVFAP